MSKNQNQVTLLIEVNGHAYEAELYDTEASKTFQSKLPLTLTMDELNGNEKYCYLPFSLPTDAGCPKNIQAGDLSLFGSSCLVLFYESFQTSYSYTKIGKIKNANDLSKSVGSSSVEVKFSLK